MSDRGRFIVVEGPDGTGTTTQVARIVEALEARLGRAVRRTAEPSSGAVGQHTRALLKTGDKSLLDWQKLALMFAADRLAHITDEIEPSLALGEWVVSDRYVLSSLVYQGLHVDVDWVREINRFAPAPDLTLVITLPLDEALARVHRRDKEGEREVYETREIQARVHAAYREHGRAVAAVEVDGSGTPDDVTARLLAAIADRGML